LPDILHRHKLDKVDFIKIDTEGHEFSILRAGYEIIRQLDPWIYLEFNALLLSTYGNINPKDFLCWIFDHFHYVFQIKKSGPCRLIPVDRSQIYKILFDHMVINHLSDDLLCTNKESALDIAKYLIIPRQTQQVDKENEKIKILHSELTDIKMKLDSIYNSKSWRITAPLRYTAKILRGR
jgi:hypothetical protein